MRTNEMRSVNHSILDALDTNNSILSLSPLDAMMAAPKHGTDSPGQGIGCDPGWPERGWLC